LGLADIDICDWKFVESWQVSAGPWALYGDTAVAMPSQNKVKLASRSFSRGESTD
jgi:hypothetical protein